MIKTHNHSSLCLLVFPTFVLFCFTICFLDSFYIKFYFLNSLFPFAVLFFFHENWFLFSREQIFIEVKNCSKLFRSGEASLGILKIYFKAMNQQYVKKKLSYGLMLCMLVDIRSNHLMEKNQMIVVTGYARVYPIYFQIIGNILRYQGSTMKALCVCQ